MRDVSQGFVGIEKFAGGHGASTKRCSSEGGRGVHPTVAGPVTFDSDALFNLGLVLSKKGDSKGALEAYEASAAVNADDVELLYNLAMKYEEANRKEEGIQAVPQGPEGAAVFFKGEV